VGAADLEDEDGRIRLAVLRRRAHEWILDQLGELLAPFHHLLASLHDLLAHQRLILAHHLLESN